MVNAGEETRKKQKIVRFLGNRSHDIFFGFTIWLRSHTVVNKVPFGTLEPYGDRARRREGFEPHDLRVIASRPSSSRVVLRARQAALPKLALWKTPLAKTPCPWRFDFANPTSHARRSHNPTKEKTARWAVSSFVCIAPPKKISAENPYDIRGFGIF